jgi:serine/threonine protein kinase
MIERTMSHYRIFEKLGQGGMDVVCRAGGREHRRTVALMSFAEPTCSSEGAPARSLREARMAASLNHPSICTIHEVGETDPSSGEPSGANALRPRTPFIAMESLQGQTLIATGPTRASREDGLTETVLATRTTWPSRLCASRRTCG